MITAIDLSRSTLPYPACDSPNTSWWVTLDTCDICLVDRYPTCSIQTLQVCEGLWPYHDGHMHEMSTPPPMQHVSCGFTWYNPGLVGRFFATETAARFDTSQKNSVRIGLGFHVFSRPAGYDRGIRLATYFLNDGAP